MSVIHWIHTRSAPGFTYKFICITLQKKKWSVTTEYLPLLDFKGNCTKIWLFLSSSVFIDAQRCHIWHFHDVTDFKLTFFLYKCTKTHWEGDFLFKNNDNFKAKNEYSDNFSSGFNEIFITYQSQLVIYMSTHFMEKAIVKQFKHIVISFASCQKPLNKHILRWSCCLHMSRLTILNTLREKKCWFISFYILSRFHYIM